MDRRKDGTLTVGTLCGRQKAKLIHLNATWQDRKEPGAGGDGENPAHYEWEQRMRNCTEIPWGSEENIPARARICPSGPTPQRISSMSRANLCPHAHSGTACMATGRRQPVSTPGIVVSAIRPLRTWQVKQASLKRNNATRFNKPIGGDRKCQQFCPKGQWVPRVGVVDVVSAAGKMSRALGLHGASGATTAFFTELGACKQPRE